MTFPGPYAASLNGAYDRQSQVFGYSVPSKYIRPENIQYPHIAYSFGSRFSGLLREITILSDLFMRDRADSRKTHDTRTP